jgi:hypothetical protein
MKTDCLLLGGKSATRVDTYGEPLPIPTHKSPRDEEPGRCELIIVAAGFEELSLIQGVASLRGEAFLRQAGNYGNVTPDRAIPKPLVDVRGVH